MANTQARRALARKIAEEGAILLRNEGGLLPFGTQKRIAVFGRTQIDTIKGGTGSANCDCAYTVSILDGMREAGIPVCEDLAARYLAWTKKHSLMSCGVWGSGMHANPEMPVDEVFSEEITADAALVVIGRTAGENEDMALAGGDWYLSDEERDLLRAVTERFPGKTAVLFNAGGLMDFSFLDEYGVSALLHGFLPGMEGARAIGDLLAGYISPSGKLTVTAPRCYEAAPTAGHFGQTGGGILQDYTEDIYIGYRYYETFPEAKENVLFPFGFGLSYTTFRVGDLALDTVGKMPAVTATVTNTGACPGAETVQVYFTAPGPGEGAKLTKPAKQLIGFERTKTLAPGETTELRILLDVARMASYDDTGVTGHRNAWVLEKGTYKILAGTDSSRTEPVGVLTREKTEVLETCHEIGTELEKRLCGDGSYETLETLALDPQRGIRIGAAGETRVAGDLFAAKTGDSVTYRLIAGATGGYYLRLETTYEGRFSDRFLLSLGGVEQKNFDMMLPGTGEVVLPAGVSELSIRTRDGECPSIEALMLEKTNPMVEVPASGSVRFAASRFFESAFGVNVRQFSDDGQGNPVTVITNFWNPGKSVTYKLSVAEAGVYDLTVRYANCGEDTVLSDACALFVSNVGQTISPVPVRHTSDLEEDCRVLAETEPVQIALPAGECYLKVVSAIWRFPDLESFTLKRSERGTVRAAAREETAASTSAGYGVSLIDPEPDANTAGILLADVASGKHSMREFLAQFSDADLIRAVSGNARNVNEYGVSGCVASGLRKFGVTPLETSDGPLGLRLAALTTAYPSGSMLSSSFDPALAEEFGLAIGEEAAELGVDIWLAPGVNLYRDPRCGRTFEYYSEDPLLAAAIATGVTRGVQSAGTSVCVKHFAVNNTEHERLKSDSRVSARAMRELYLRVFEYIFRDADPWCAMSSYNHINGRKASEQRVLITDVAREEWGWNGIFLSDWDNDSKHVEEVLAGQDVKMSSGDVEGLSAALADGTLTREDFYPLVERICRTVMKTRAFRDETKKK